MPRDKKSPFAAVANSAPSAPIVPTVIKPRIAASMAGTLDILQEMLSQILEQRLPYQNAHAASELADKISGIAETDLKMIDLALTHHLDYRGCGFLPEIDENQSATKTDSRRVRA